MTRREIDRRFNLSRPATKEDGERCDAIRAAIKHAACEVVENTPPGREQELAIGKLEEAVYFAIGAVVRPDVEG